MNMKSQKNLNLQHFRGISLLEVMLAIIVITAIALASVRYYSTTRENARITQALAMVN